MSGVPVLLITANVGSIFEEPGVMLKMWTEEFLSTVARLDPKFIALHCQEVGGKNYEQSMRHVEDFVRLLMSSEELRLFNKVRVFLDEDFSSAEHFTALGNFYFVHESLKDVFLWDFKDCTFIPVSGKEVHSGNIEAVTTKEKAKFPQDFFPECKWSRKGFLRTRWNISGTIFDLINIHLFHDASNFIAMETFPSVYSKTRRRALEHTLDRFHNDQYQNAPYFLFGDFNFRTDTAGVIKKLTEDTHESKMSSKGNISKLQFRNDDENLILTLGKKEFSYYEHRNVFTDNSGQWMREYDRELDDFTGRLFEFPIDFVPSYPFEEDIKQGTNYMQTRVPAWCDRILLSPAAQTLVQNISSSDAVEYGIIGPTTCMGDHKPVYLRAILTTDAGMINCCTSKNPQELCFHIPEHYQQLLSMLPDCRSSFLHLRSSSERYGTTSSQLLHAIPIEHDPYTPDSMDSPSPSAFVPTSDIEIQDYDYHNNENIKRPPSLLKRLDSAVSPTLLKSKLELIVQSEEKAEKEREKKDLSDYRLNSWPESKCKQSRGIRKYRCNSDVSCQKSWDKDKYEKSSSNSSIDDSNELQIIIPRIAIITASNFESNESSVNLQDEKFNMHFKKSNKSLNTSGEGSSLEMDICHERNIFLKDVEKISGAQDSGLDTLDVDDGFSRGGSMGLSSNETTSTIPLDCEKDERKFDDFSLINETNKQENKIQNIEIIRSNSRDEILISNETIKENDSDNEIIKLKACRATQRYGNNVVNKNGKCGKCCCVIS